MYNLVKIDEMRREMREVEAQKDLERLGAGLDSGVESSGKKRRREG